MFFALDQSIQFQCTIQLDPRSIANMLSTSGHMSMFFVCKDNSDYPSDAHDQTSAKQKAEQDLLSSRHLKSVQGWKWKEEN